MSVGPDFPATLVKRLADRAGDNVASEATMQLHAVLSERDLAGAIGRYVSQ